MVIHGILVTCFRSLAFSFQLFEMVLCVCGFENVLKNMPCLGNLCNDSCLNIYKGVCLFEKIIQCFASFFDQVTKSLSTLFYLKIFIMF